MSKSIIQNSNNDVKKAKINKLEVLYEFMDQFRNKKSGKDMVYTHTMTHSPYGAYNIPEDKYVQFRKLYANAIIAGYKPHITEKHKEYGPIVIDLDFLQSKENEKRYYTDITISNIVKVYNKVINKYLNVESQKMLAYVAEKRNPVLRGGKYHDGIHIVYPYICTKPSLQMLIRQEVIEIVKKYNMLKKIPLLNTLEDVFDKGIIYQTNWMLYGSIKDPNSLVYNITKILLMINGKIENIISPDENLHSDENVKHFIDAMSCRRFDNNNDISELANDIDPEVIDEKINNITKSIVKKSDMTVSNIMGQNFAFITVAPEETYVEVKNLTKILSKKRASEYYSWYRVGLCLHNIDHRLLEDWIEFSKQCPSKFKQGECELLWRKMKQNNYTIATLNYFASQDNKKLYLEYKQAKINQLVKNGLEGSHHTIAKLVIEKYKGFYKCGSVKHNLWYKFENHMWIEDDSAHSLSNLISSEIISEYAKRQQFLYEISREKDGYKKEKCFQEADAISKVIRQLNNNNFKSGVIKEAANLSYDRNFLTNLDENIYLLCFTNGVYDLEADIFRDGCPDDNITLCTGYDYIPYDKNDQCVAEIKDFFKKIQPDPVIRKYLLTLFATCLAGSICDESLYVMTGSGANGKSKIMELMKNTLGKYFKPMDKLVLVGKRTSSSSATPELADKKGIRACPFDETEADDTVNTGFMKIFTGGDLMTARALFREPIYFKPQFKPFLLCNVMPQIKSDDDGTWRRLKVIHFPSKFLRPHEVTEKIKKNGLGENQFWADSNLSEKIPEWKQAFMTILIRYYRKYRKNGLVHPKLVTKHTNDYRKRCDFYQDFLGDYLDFTNDENDSITIMALHNGMKNWTRANGGKTPGSKEIRTYMQHKMPTFNVKKDCLTCYRIKECTEDNVVYDLADI